MPTISDLFREVGAALHTAQVVEFNIASAMILLAKTGHAESVSKLKEVDWSRKPLGHMLDPVVKSNLLPEDAKALLETVIAARNYLAHSFFVSSSSVHTPDGVTSLLREVAAMQGVFDRANLFFDQVLGNLVRPYGVEYEKVKAEARETILSFDDLMNAKPRS